MAVERMRGVAPIHHPYNNTHAPRQTWQGICTHRRRKSKKADCWSRWKIVTLNHELDATIELS